MGDVVCFSFHPRKVITTGEGGMLTTRDAGAGRELPALAAARHVGARHGASRQRDGDLRGLPGPRLQLPDDRHAGGDRAGAAHPPAGDRRPPPGPRGPLPRRCSPMLDGVAAPDEPDWARSNWQSYCVGSTRASTSARVMQHMLDAGVATRRGIMCMHLEAAHADLALAIRSGAPKRARDRPILLPLYAQMTRDEQDRVVEAVAGAGCCGAPGSRDLVRA